MDFKKNNCLFLYSLPVTAGKENYELLIPVPIPFPIPPPGSHSKRSGSDASTHTRSGIVNSMRRTLGTEGAKLPLVVPLKIDEELLTSPHREKVKCPKIEVTSC